MVNPFLAADSDAGERSDGGRSRRPWPLLAGLAAAAVLVAAAAVVQVRLLAPVEEDLAAVTALDAEALRLHAAAMERLRSGAATNAGAAAAIERDCLPRWAEAARRVETLRADGVQGEALPTLSAYLGERAEAARLLAGALRDGDSAGAAAAKAAWARAERLAAAIEAGRVAAD